MVAGVAGLPEVLPGPGGPYDGAVNPWLVLATLAVSAAPADPPSLLGITLTRTSFSQVGVALGHATLTRAGEDVQACYTAARAGDRTVVVFTSGAMGGFGLEVGAFALHARAPDRPGMAGCTRSSRVRSDVVTSTGLRLGMSEAAVVKLLGSPAERSPGRLVYRSVRAQAPAPAVRERFAAAGRALGPDDTVQLHEETRLELVGGRVTSIEVARAESI